MRVLILLLLPLVAFGQQVYPLDITLTWTNPSLYVDDTEIQAGDLAETRITCSRHSGETVLDATFPVTAGPGGAESETIPGAIPQPGTYKCLAYSITVDNISSDASNPAERKYTGKPKEILNLTVQ
jgi:hypothetical protein